MRVLIACEESQVVCKAFRAQGHDAFSCDIQDCSGGHPEWHIKDDVLKHIRSGWDLMIAHPPCTYLTNSAEWAYKEGPYHQKVKDGTLVGARRVAAREESLEFVKELLNAPINKIVLENPVGTISSRIFWYLGHDGLGERWEIFPTRTIGGIKPTQIIHPWMFGDDASKSTCLYIKGLKPLKPTKIIEPKIINGKKRWANQSPGGQDKTAPSDDRGKMRSKTFLGIAQAMAEQWG